MNDGRATILLIEDNPLDIELTLNALERGVQNFHIHTAHDGEEALEFIRHLEDALPTAALQPRLILLDLKLPKLSGLEVLQKIKENPATRIIPVVVLTSSGDEDDILKCYSLGVNSYIQKPVSFEEYRKLVQNLVFYWLETNLTPSWRVVQGQAVRGAWLTVS